MPESKLSPMQLRMLLTMLLMLAQPLEEYKQLKTGDK